MGQIEMMRAAVALFGACIVTLTVEQASAQQQASEPIPYKPEVGQTYSVVSKRKLLDVMNDAIKRDVAATTRARLTILSSNPEGYVAEWEILSLDVGAETITDEPSLMIGLPIQVELASDGSPANISNWPSVVERVIDDRTNEPITIWCRGIVIPHLQLFDFTIKSDALGTQWDLTTCGRSHISPRETAAL